jgi:transcriptional regulator with XRE-family HTH domain
MTTLKEEIVLDLTMRGGEALAELRERAGVTREFLAVHIGRASSTVELWERMGKPIKNTDIVRIAEVIKDQLGDGNRSRNRA